MNTTAPLRPTKLPPTKLRERRISLAAGPAAPAAARSQLKQAVEDWRVRVDLAVAALLTSELVTNAVTHEREATVLLVITGTSDLLRVDVHDTSDCVPVLVDAPVEAEAGRGLMLIDSLATGWGYYPTPTGKAVYFTLTCQAGL